MIKTFHGRLFHALHSLPYPVTSQDFSFSCRSCLTLQCPFIGFFLNRSFCYTVWSAMTTEKKP